MMLVEVVVRVVRLGTGSGVVSEGWTPFCGGKS